MIDDLHSSDIQQGEIDGKSGVTRSIVDERYSTDMQAEQMEGESGAT